LSRRPCSSPPIRVITTHGVANYHWRNWLNKLPMTEYSVSGIFRQWAPPRALRFPGLYGGPCGCTDPTPVFLSHRPAHGCQGKT
jgi:hypothetical protein